MTDRDSSPQTILGPDGTPLYKLVPIDTYRTLTQALADVEDMRAAVAAMRRDTADLLPARVVHRIATGENPVRVWREHRGLKAVELARAAGISPAYLSELETGKKDGTFRTMTAIAACLDVRLDDLAPILARDEMDAAQIEAARIQAIKAQIRIIEALITGPNDFDTGSVRRAATSLARDAQDLLATQSGASVWLQEVLRGAQEILDLVQRAEGNIIETAEMARHDLERALSFDLNDAPRAVRMTAAE